MSPRCWASTKRRCGRGCSEPGRSCAKNSQASWKEDMESEKRERLIDDLLDNALKQYGAAEPRAGLEDRVLAAVRIEGRRVTPRNWSWWPAVIACVVLLLSVAGAFLARNHH